MEDDIDASGVDGVVDVADKIDADELSVSAPIVLVIFKAKEAAVTAILATVLLNVLLLVLLIL